MVGEVRRLIVLLDRRKGWVRGASPRGTSPEAPVQTTPRPPQIRDINSETKVFILGAEIVNIFLHIPCPGLNSILRFTCSTLIYELEQFCNKCDVWPWVVDTK